MEKIQSEHCQDNHGTIKNIYEGTTHGGQLCIAPINMKVRTEVNLGSDDPTFPAVGKFDGSVDGPVGVE